MKVLIYRLVFCTFFISLLLPPFSHAQIYKWVDANGRTHYSEKREHASTSKTDELKIKSQATSKQSANTSTEYWQEQERQLRQRQIENSDTKLDKPSQHLAKPKSLSGGRSDDTSSSKCNLARDVLNGAVRHSNGAPTDKYDREVAENDIRTYC
jgi:hypothetical protein